MTELDVAYSFNPNNHNNYQNFNNLNSNNTNSKNDNDDDDVNENYENYENLNENNNERLPEKKEVSSSQQRKERKEEQIQQIQQPPMIIPNNYNYNYNTNYEEKPHKPPPKKVQRNPEYSFWDRMVLSKNDVIKLVIFSLIIVLGISIEKIIFHYINQYLTENLLSPMQDFLVRLSIPVSLILFLWIIKSL